MDRRYIGLGIAVMGAMAVAGSFIAKDARSGARKLAEGDGARATLIIEDRRCRTTSGESPTTTCYGTVTVADGEREPAEAKVRIREDQGRGDEVSVIYDPDDPTAMVPAHLAEPSAMPAVLLVGGIAMVLAGAGVGIGAVRRRRAAGT